MKNFILSWLLISLVAANAVASKKDYSMLKPGFQGVIFPVKDGGQSITMKLDDEGFTICASQLNPVDGVIPAPTHCNLAITPIGFHIPAEILFGSNSKFWNDLKIVGKVALAAAPLALGAFSNLGVTSEAAQATSNVLAPNPLQLIEAEGALPNAFSTVIHEGQRTTESGFGTIPVAFVSNRFFDLVAALQDRVGKFADQCKKAPEVKGNYCNDQLVNMVNTINFDAYTNTPMQPTNIGEPGQGEIPTEGPNVESVEQAIAKSKAKPALAADMPGPNPVILPSAAAMASTLTGGAQAEATPAKDGADTAPAIVPE
jgi:hypothetical protein